MKKLAFLIFLCIGAISMVVMSFHYFLSDTAGILKRKEITSSLWYLFTFRTHIFLGLIAIALGPFQFINRLRSKHKIIHRVIGYVYAISVLTSAVMGLIIAQFAMGGWITTIGFTTLSMAWFYTTIMAIISIRKGHELNHKKWMFLSYGLTFGAITQRMLLLIPLLTAIPFMPIYQLSSWLPWIVNSSIAYSLYQKSNRQNIVP